MTRAITCQRCDSLALRNATVMEAATVAVKHLDSGCPADEILIHPLRRRVEAASR